ncbi:GAF domain-containing protein [Catelliglobosispora koreensis]|uniref:GAF domain-containing protein n=1 Tax=Catelliglobosispora koreensis TaxID=129052 RepID=UPI00036738F6|nr:GAF domain-containing protein [Catelliglobosispora koreensis]
MVTLTTGVLSDSDPQSALSALVRHAREIVNAKGAAVSVPVEGEHEWRIAVSVGTLTRWQDKRIPLEGSITGEVVMVADPGTDDRTHETWPDALGVVGQSVAVPLRGERGTSGVLILARGPGEPDL